MTTEEKLTSEPEQKELVVPENDIKLDISLDCMCAVVKVKFPLQTALSLEDIIALLNVNNVKVGFDQVAAGRHIEQINNSLPDREEYKFDVARGTPPVLAQNGKIELLIKDTPHVTFDKDGRADFRNIEKFKNVKAKTVLARHIPPKLGTDGYDIRGRVVKPAKPKDMFLVCGDNVSFSEETEEYIAEEDGIFFRDGKKHIC